MVIRKQDRVSDVLKHDESLVDVFAALSPAFERLRNRALRRVMARLVTVEQAARMGGVDADELVARLNAADGETGRGEGHGATAAPAPTPSGNVAAGPARETAELPPVLAAIPEDRVIDVDVRDDLQNGREPFSRIMAARRRVPPGGALRLRAIFEPVPLYAVLAKQGLAHYTEQPGPEDWRVWFFADGSPAAGYRGGDDAGTGDGEDADTGSGGAVDEPGGDVVVLDVRGLEPPEPMVRTLAALETLPASATLVQINVRVPQFLLPQLEARGFVYEIREQRSDLVRVFIQRASPA
ncbi:MAG: DUF2249 domain-containing protein [Gemmatimonadota bacterium]